MKRGSLAVSRRIVDEDLLESVPPELFHLIPSFLERRQREIVELEHLIAENNFSAIKDLGHKLKGTGAGYGFQAISDMGQGLEAAALARDIVRTRATLINLADLIDRILISANNRRGDLI